MAIPETTIARFIWEEIPIGGNEEQCVEFQCELVEIPSIVNLEIDKRTRCQYGQPLRLRRSQEEGSKYFV
jgi:hypothetical protein